MIPITNQEFELLARFIKLNSGIHLRDEKKTLLVSRLTHLLTELGVQTFSEYYQLLVRDKTGMELSRLVDKITTNHTYFMREAEHFDFFRTTVLPFLKNSVKDRDLRIWCAASSSGEEPYTLAFILDDFFSGEALFWDKKILATDLSLNVLEKAKEGIYSEEAVSTLSKMWVLNYFTKMHNNNFIVNQKIKDQVIYRRFNLLENHYPFKKKFHVIFCRNVMIYFDQETKNKVTQQLYDQLEVGGYLFIGHSESIVRDTTKFRYVQPAVYRKL